MFTREGLLALHHRAHASFSSLIGHVASLPAEALKNSLHGFGQENLREILLHIAESEDWWVRQLTGEEIRQWEYNRYESAEAIRDAFQDVAQRTAEYLSSQTDESLDEVVHVSGEGWSFDTRPGWVVMHVITHGFHHKGQAATACRMMGAEPPDTDMSIGV